MTNGKCTSCTGSLILNNGDCIVKQVITNVQTQSQNPPITSGGGAIVINNNQGSSSTSIPIPTPTPNPTQTTTKPNTSTTTSSNIQDQNCLKWESNKCTKCSDRFYMSQT